MYAWTARPQNMEKLASICGRTPPPGLLGAVSTFWPPHQRGWKACLTRSGYETARPLSVELFAAAAFAIRPSTLSDAETVCSARGVGVEVSSLWPTSENVRP